MIDDIDPKTYFSLSMRRDGKDVNVNFDGVDVRVPQVLEEVLHFMKACGYCFDIDDRIEVVNDFRFEDSTQKPELDLSWLDNYPDPEMTNFDHNNPNHIIKPEG
jgi:hypothetical protein